MSQTSSTDQRLTNAANSLALARKHRQPTPRVSEVFELGVWGAMEPKTNVSSESHRKGAFRSPAHPPGITL